MRRKHFTPSATANIAGQHATWRLKQLIASGRLELQSTGRREKWGRLLAHLIINGEDVADIAIREGWGRAYNGGKRLGWCG